MKLIVINYSVYVLCYLRNCKQCGECRNIMPMFVWKGNNVKSRSTAHSVVDIMHNKVDVYLDYIFKKLNKN